MHIKIGEVETLRTENWEVIPDDRQTRVETIGGLVIQDFGRVEVGDSFSCSVTVSVADSVLLNSYWTDRRLVDVRDTSGNILSDMRVVIKKYGYVERFETYYWAEIEFWRV